MNAQVKPVEVEDNMPMVGTTNDLVFNPVAMQSMMALATIMAESTVTVPKHLQGKKGDCFAVIMQAAQWKMNPFVVAQKTHVVNGTLGYEAQLVNALVMASGAIIGSFSYEYKGEGSNLECRVGAVIKGHSSITWSEWLSIKSITTQNSPLWKTNPKQQLGYLQVKNWARAYYPGAILGVYSADELEVIGPSETIINPRPEDLAPTAEALVERIGQMTEDDLTPDNLRNLDMKPYSEAEVKMIKNAVTQRRKALKEAAVVATQTPSNQQPGPGVAGVEDWKQMIQDAQTQEELLGIYDAIPNDLKPNINDEYDTRMDALR